MFLDVFDDVFLLDLAFESAERCLYGFTIVDHNYCHKFFFVLLYTKLKAYLLHYELLAVKDATPRPDRRIQSD